MITKTNFKIRNWKVLRNINSKRTFGTIECIATLANITNDLSPLLVQFSDFINQFNHHLASYDINVIHDAKGNDISIMDNHDPKTEELIVKKYLVLEGILEDRKNKIEALLNRGQSLLGIIKSEQPDFTSEILKQAEEFQRIRSNFKG